MSDSPVRTLVHTDEGDLPFQHYFVRCRCEPMVIDLTFVGAAEACPSEAVVEALTTAELVIFSSQQSRSVVSIRSSIPGLRQQLRRMKAPKIAVSPIVGGQAVKGPAAKMMRELGNSISPLTVVDHFDGLLTGFVDEQDAVLRVTCCRSADPGDEYNDDRFSQQNAVGATGD